MASSEEFEVQLSAEERELLERAREQRRSLGAPQALRQRLLQRALEDGAAERLLAGATPVADGLGSPVVAASALEVVPRWTWRSTVR
jgi:hypothetical protein